MKAKIGLIALALAGTLPLAAFAAQPADKPAASEDSYGSSRAATPASPATPATPATPASPSTGAAATPATPASPAAAATPTKPGAPMPSGQAAFRQLDKNHDGKISKDEADAMSDLQTRFATLDTDHDGTISAREWATGNRDQSSSN
jgi:EF hand domain-containing protein